MREITVYAPATVANLGSGFDLMGLAIEKIADEVTIKERADDQLLIKEIIGDHGLLPRDPDENTCTVAIKSLLRKLHIKKGFDVTIRKHIAFNSGLGSSASSAVAGVFAVNELLGRPFSKMELIPFAVDGEYIASKGFHADNVAPCMLGGITFIQDLNPLSIEQIYFHEDTFLVVLYQYVSISTSEARAILPKEYDRSILTKQSSRIASLLFGLGSNNDKYLRLGLGDEIATPFRRQLIPHFDSLHELAMNNRATGFNISGSGPSVFAWCKNEMIARKIEEQWSNFMKSKNERFEVYCSKINQLGVVTAG